MEGITELFFKNAKKRPKKCAIWCDGKEISYGDLAHKVIKYANLFLENGISYGDHIGFPMTNSIESVAIMLTVAQIGCALVPINPTLPLEAVERAFQLGEVKHLIARKSFLEKYVEKGLNNSLEKIICSDCEYKDAIYLEATPKQKELPNITKSGQELFIITMTSGSTGDPKPIALSQRNKWNRAWKHIKLYNLNEEDRIMAATPLYHSLAERLVLMPLMLGATSILLPRFTPSLWLKCTREQKVTFTIAVSAQLAQVAEILSCTSVPEISSLRCVVSSSSLLEPHVRTDLIDKLSCDFHEMYGTSETSTVTDINFREAVNKQKSVGKPLEGVKIGIAREDGTLCSVNEIGEILCETDLICEGYFGVQDKFEKSCRDNFFKTGDLGYLDEDGYLYYSGRKKDVIITGGINVYPIDIEQCVSKLQAVKECAAFPYQNERLGEVVAIAVVKNEDKELSTREIQVQCAKNLADFQQPHKIFVVDELPKNALGKIVKSKILEMVRK